MASEISEILLLFPYKTTITSPETLGEDHSKADLWFSHPTSAFKVFVRLLFLSKTKRYSFKARQMKEKYPIWRCQERIKMAKVVTLLSVSHSTIVSIELDNHQRGILEALSSDSGEKYFTSTVYSTSKNVRAFLYR